MSQSYVLDTNVVLALIRGKELGARIDGAFGIRASFHHHIVSIVTEAELLVMADKHKWGPDKRKALEFALENVVVMPVDGQGLVDAYVAIAAADRSTERGGQEYGQE